MNAYIVAQEILNHYGKTRQAGHTLATLKGATNVVSKVVVHNQDMKQELDKMAGEPVASISLTEIERGYLVGSITPIVFDNYALQQVLGELVGTIAALRKDKEDLNQKIRLVKSLLS